MNKVNSTVNNGTLNELKDQMLQLNVNCDVHNEKLSEMKDQLLQQQAVITGMYNQLEEMTIKVNNKNGEMHENKRVQTYAEKLKTKNTLIIKSNSENGKAADNRKTIMRKIKTQVDDVRETKDGHLIVNLANKEKLEEAKRELEENKEETNISVTEKEKLKPKIKVCNVPNCDDDVVEGIKIKNPWINDLINDEEDFKIIMQIKARQENEQHFIIKCNPQIRKQIFLRDNILYTTYGRKKVFDSYKVYQCYKCQDFGHSAKRCDKEQVCAKCGDNHRLADCDKNVEKCVNCVKKGNSDVNHRTNGTNCPIYKEELSRIKNKTDHGFI